MRPPSVQLGLLGCTRVLHAVQATPVDGVLLEALVEVLRGEGANTPTEVSLTAYLPCHEQRTAAGGDEGT